MLAKFLPKEVKFFELFQRSADLILEGAKEFQEMLSDLEHAESRARKIKSIESSADEVTHRTIDLLHTTFITPLDRDDIHRLITRMDDILDYIDAASDRVALYKIKKSTPELESFAEITIKCAEDIKFIISRLENLKNGPEIRKRCVELNRLENEADCLLRAAMAKLFGEEQDVRQLIKFKEIYELLEMVSDRCEDVANLVESIVLEYS